MLSKAMFETKLDRSLGLRLPRVAMRQSKDFVPYRNFYATALAISGRVVRRSLVDTEYFPAGQSSPTYVYKRSILSPYLTCNSFSLLLSFIPMKSNMHIQVWQCHRSPSSMLKCGLLGTQISAAEKLFSRLEA